MPESRLERTRRVRLADLVAFARANSPYYKELYKDLPEKIEDAEQLPVTNKRNLMARYDDWATDRDVTYEKVKAFLGDPSLIGKRFLGKYRVATTSGVTGTRVFFVIDEKTDSVIRSVTQQMMLSWFGWFGAISLLLQTDVLKKGRTASIIATGGHTAAFSRVTMEADANSREKRKVFSVHTPLPELVSELNRYRPTFLQGYASTIALLAQEQEAGRLHIGPSFVLPTSEGLSDRQYDEIAKAFRAKVGIAYGGTECGAPVAWSCKERWLHLNSEWAMVEPVDADFKPVAPGVQSYTVLITNLANRVEPIIRYDMGDSVILRPDSCPCGNRNAAIRVLGRVADVLTLFSQDAGEVKITSLQLVTVFERAQGVQLFQVVQTNPTTLRVRLRTFEGSDPSQVWQKVQDEMSSMLRSNHLENVRVERAEEPPEQAEGGKYREVIPLSR